MGIQGLLPFLKKIHSPINVSKFEGSSVAIDAYCWLHKGAFACADKLALGEKTDVYVYYCMKYLECMLKKNVKPIMVFDGCRLPSKKDVEKSRREKRQMYRKKAAQMLREGKRAEARECLQRCIDITPEMALELMNVCRARGIDCIVAPYEADAQLAFLCKQGIAQAIITEDSDLLLFGCQQVIFKMDHFGNGILIESDRLNEVLGISDGYYTFDKFRYMCIMSGCDYLPSLPGIGLGKASKVFKLARQTDLKVYSNVMSTVIMDIPGVLFTYNLYTPGLSHCKTRGNRTKQLLKKFPSTYLKMSLTVPQEYVDNFIKADNTFLYQLVFNPLTRKLVPLNPYPAEVNKDELHYAGPYMPTDRALQISLGNINIYNMEMFANFDPDTYVPPKAKSKTSSCLHQLSIWNKHYRVKPKFVNKEAEEVSRPDLQGKEQNCSFTLRRRSPKKRPVEENKDTKSDTELSGIYQSSTSPLKEESSNRYPGQLALSPRPKRARLDLSNSDEETESSVDKDTTPESTEEKVNFMVSLQEAETEVNVSPGRASPKDKENCLLSPKRNRFAVMMGKRPRFDINAKKEVKSRYFASSTEKDSKSIEPMSSEESSVPVTQKNSPVTEPKLASPEPKVSSPIKRTKDSKQVKASPGSVFSWSKFKFNKQTEKQSPKVNSQFKQLVCNKPGIKNFLPKSLSASQIVAPNSDDVTVIDVAASQPIPCSHGNNSQDSQCSDIDVDDLSGSLCGSVDCMSDSQSSQDTKQNLSIDSQHSQDTSTAGPLPKVSTTALPLVTPVISGGSKSTCRVSGLSRGQKTNKTSKSRAPDTKQRCITDLFSKFSHTSSAPKLSHSGKAFLKQEDEQAMTPSTDNRVLSNPGGVQRKLLS